MNRVAWPHSRVVPGELSRTAPRVSQSQTSTPIHTRVVVYAWVYDRDTLRKAGAGTDPYTVSGHMLASGNPPDDWPAPLVAARNPDAVQRLNTAETASEDS